MIRRRTQVDERAIEEFAVQAEAPRAAQVDPKAKPTMGLNVRFNAYQHGLLVAAAEQEDVSMQKVISRTLWPALEELLKQGIK